MLVLFLFLVGLARSLEVPPLLSYLFTFQPGTYGDTSGSDPAKTATARFVRQLHWIDANCRRNNISYEVVVAMWPVAPNDRMRDGDLFRSLRLQNLTLPRQLALMKLIYVPIAAVQRAIKNIPSRLFVLEYVGKNIAARRARGRFLVLGGTDCLVHERFYTWLATAKPERMAIYGMHRLMLRSSIKCAMDDFDCVVAHRNAAVSSKLVAPTSGRLLKNYTLSGPVAFGEGNKWSAAGDFTALTSDAMHDLRGYAEVPFRTHVDTLFIYQAVAAKKKPWVFKEPIVCFHQNHDRGTDIIDPAPINADAQRNSFASLVSHNVFAPSNPLHNWGFADTPMTIQIVRNGKIVQAD